MYSSVKRVGNYLVKIRFEQGRSVENLGMVILVGENLSILGQIKNKLIKYEELNHYKQD